MKIKRKVLITSRSFGQCGDEAINLLKDKGFELDYNNDPFDLELFNREIENYDALIIGAHDFSRLQMEKARKLKVIVKHGSGIDNLDVSAAKDLGISIANAPGENSNAVADIALGLILDCSRGISKGANEVKTGQWNKILGVNVYGKTLGLVGFGAIARKVAKRARGFDMKIMAYDPFVQVVDVEVGFVEMTSFEKIIETCDYLSIHVPLNDNTRNLIGRDEMTRMKKGSFIINTSRGSIVNEADLYDAVMSGHLGGAGLDVTEKEPPIGSPLLDLDNVTVLPHIGMYSKEAINSVSLICSQNICNFFDSKELKNKIC